VDYSKPHIEKMMIALELSGKEYPSYGYAITEQEP
jgi:hypothetical protein